MRNRLSPTITLTVTLLFTAACGSSNDTAQVESPTALATELIYEYGQAIYNRDQDALGALLSDSFLLRRTDGSGFTRQGEQLRTR
jgi:hypothetical protein